MRSERFAGIKERDLRWNALYWRERELIEPASSRKRGHQVKDGVAMPQSKLWPIIAPIWENCREENEEKLEEKKVQWQAQSGIQHKGQPQDLILLLRLWNTYKKGPIMTALQKTQQATERVTYRYFYTTNGQKLLTPVVELWECCKKLRRVEIL